MDRLLARPRAVCVAALVAAVVWGCGSADRRPVLDGRPRVLAVSLGGLAPTTGPGPAPLPTSAMAGAVPVEASAVAPSAAPAGPVPDFAPMGRIVTHQLAWGSVPELPAVLTELLGERHVEETMQGPDPDPEEGDDPRDGDGSLLWMRDYQPIFVRRADGTLKAVRYLHENPNRSRYVPSPHVVGRGVPVETLPLLHENGNLVTTGSFVFVSERLLEDNAQALDVPHLRRAGYQPRDADRVLKLLARALERSVWDVVVLPPMPHEGTAHVDMFVMPLAEREVMVPEVRPEALKATSDPDERTVGEDVRLFLDDQAAFLAELGLRVHRLPMIAPRIGDDSEASGEMEVIVYSPANGLLVPVGGERHVMLPSFAGEPDLPLPARRLAGRYEREWSRFFRRHGWTPRLVDSAELAHELGLLHCVTASIPE